MWRKNNEGKGPGDRDKIIARWNAWADKSGVDDYAACTLTPYCYGPDQEFDVLWLSAGKDAVALGKAQDAYLGEDSGLRAGFNEVLTCDAHVNYASLNFKAPPKGETPNNSVLTFSNCKYKEGEGSKSGIWHWYPIYGGGGEEFSFKWLESFKNFAELGADYESYGNGGGYKTNGRLFNSLIDCDSSRAYVAQNRRFIQLR